MPFKSEAQRKWAYANKPEMAERWEKETPKTTKLPERVGKKKKKRSSLLRAFEEGGRRLGRY